MKKVGPRKAIFQVYSSVFYSYTVYVTLLKIAAFPCNVMYMYKEWSTEAWPWEKASIMKNYHSDFALIYIRTVEFTVRNPVREGELSMNHLMMSEVSETTVPITTDMY